MSRPGFFNRGLDAGVALSLVTALLIASKRPRQPRIYSEATLALLHEEALREDWNRTVAARRAAKKASKP